MQDKEKLFDLIRPLSKDAGESPAKTYENQNHFVDACGGCLSDGLQDHVAGKEIQDAAEFRAHDTRRGPGLLRHLQHTRSGQPRGRMDGAGLAGQGSGHA